MNKEKDFLKTIFESQLRISLLALMGSFDLPIQSKIHILNELSQDLLGIYEEVITKHYPKKEKSKK